MERVLVPTVAAAAAVLVLAVVNASAGHAKAQHHNPGNHRAHGGGTIHVVERATTDAVTNGSGDSAGNILTFANDVYDSANANKVGSDQGSCIRIVVGKYWVCTWTSLLPAGQFYDVGPFF